MVCFHLSRPSFPRGGTGSLTSGVRYPWAGIMQRAPWEDFLPPSGQVKNKQVMERGLEALKLAEEEGVTVC